MHAGSVVPQTSVIPPNPMTGVVAGQSGVTHPAFVTSPYKGYVAGPVGPGKIAATTGTQPGFSAGSPFSSAYSSLFGGGQALGSGLHATTAVKGLVGASPATPFAAPGLAGVLGPAALGFAFVMGAKALDPTKTKTPDKHAGDAKKQQDIGLAIAQQNPSMVYGGRGGGGSLMDPSNKSLTNALHSAIRAIGDAKFDPPMMQKVQEILGPELFQLAQGFATSPMYDKGKTDVTGRPILTQGGQVFSGTPQATRALFGAPALTGPGSATLSAERLRQIDIRGGGRN